LRTDFQDPTSPEKRSNSDVPGRLSPPAPLPSAAVRSPANQQPAKFSLRDLTSMALDSNPILQRSQAEIDSAKGERVQAGLYPNPTFDTNTPELFGGQNSA